MATSPDGKTLDLLPPPEEPLSHYGLSMVCQRFHAHRNTLLSLLLLSGALSLALLTSPIQPWRLLETPVQQTTFFKAAVNQSCPLWFTKLHKDFVPWKERGGIELADVEAASPFAAIRFQIINGSLYVEHFHGCFQTRARYSIWGILMLLELYPGQVPDVDFMWDCGDDPRVRRPTNPLDPLPLLFNYCTLADTLDVPFPDWSFWGWPELDIPPWDEMFRKINDGASKAPEWRERKATAFWKGNPNVGYGLTKGLRWDLWQCGQDPHWLVDAYGQDWGAEIAGGFKYSRLWEQCGWRYRVYAEGNSWSVSLKYGMACAAVTLMIEPYFRAFYDHGLEYERNCLFVSRWPLCEALRSKVVWGNENEEAASAIAREGKRFMEEELSMERVYDYMLHLLSAYAALQRFQPRVSAGGQLLTKEDVLRDAPPKERKEYLKVVGRSLGTPCRLSY